MRYPKPHFSPAGDRFIEVELGDEMSFELNVQVHALAASIRGARIKGVIELVPELAALLVSYDADVISYADVIAEIARLHQTLGDEAPSEMESRLFYVPLMYFDPWTEACVDEYRKVNPDKVHDPELLCASNGLADRAALQRVHAGSEYWVAALGFWPGLCSLMPLDPRSRLSAPKYNPPRAWTPKGTIGLGGGLTAIYPDRTPGGYQIFARTPMPTWDREQRLPAFKHSMALFRAGDRVRFVPIDLKEYEHVEAEVAAGTYRHTVVECQTFRCPSTKPRLNTLDQD